MKPQATSLSEKVKGEKPGDRGGKDPIIHIYIISVSLSHSG